MTPTERLLTILRQLKEAKESGAIDAGTSVAIQQTMDGVYRGQSGQRKWRRDIQSLRDRGLIETDLPPNRTGIRLTGARKPERLHLTAEEHAAINHARRLLHPGIPMASPLGRPGSGGREDVDDITRVLRFLEENDDEVSLAQLAHWLDIPEKRAFEMVDSLTAEGVFADGLVASVEFGYDDDEEDGDDVDDLRPSTVWVLRGRNRHSPTRGRGMDELGFFPYSLAETNDRIGLIDEALASDRISPRILEALDRAHRKLCEWRLELGR